MAERDEALSAYREFAREMTLRFEHTVNRLIGEMRQERQVILEEQRMARKENQVYFEQLRADTREIIAEGKAQRAGFNRMLDRLDELEGGGPATAS